MDTSNRSKEPEDPRVRFAGERTLLAWIRTGLAMMGFGFVVARFGLFLREIAAGENIRPIVSTGISLWIGLGLVTLGVIVQSSGRPATCPPPAQPGPRRTVSAAALVARRHHIRDRSLAGDGDDGVFIIDWNVNVLFAI